MIRCEYIDLNGKKQVCDLDSMVDIVRGQSKKKRGWVALIVFDPASNKFIELRDSPPDPKGYSKDEAEEIDDNYILNNFNLKKENISFIRRNPSVWVFIDLNN